MSEVLENKSKKKSTLSNEVGKVKKANSSKSKELNTEKTKTGNKTSNKTQSVEKEKEKRSIIVKETAKKTVKESTKQTPSDKISTGKTSTRKTKTDETSNNKQTVNKLSKKQTNTSKISSNKVSTNKTKQESKTNSDTKTENDKLKKVAEKSKTESKSTTNSQQQKSNTNQKNRTTKKDTASKVNSKKDVDEKETLKKQKSNNGTTKKQNVKDEKTEINNLPAPESKFDTVSLKEIREALQNKVNDNQKQKVVKKVLINIGFAITMIVYLIIVALATKNIEVSVLEKDLKIITLGILVLGIGVLERAYKKDNTQMAINAVEILIFGAINLCMIYAIKINFIKLGDFKDIINNITYVGSAIAGYYILKSIIISIRNVKKFKKENNDIKEIIKK